uniref:Rhomboid-like protease n=1 Tax=Neospora caninum (strain Liverpool) TaxID=572307 RepID=A0A0F7U357_NEOCL|nr:TPA: rhomboid-like protease 5, putative [Neospora caninum Liverpool]
MARGGSLQIPSTGTDVGEASSPAGEDAVEAGRVRNEVERVEKRMVAREAQKEQAPPETRAAHVLAADAGKPSRISQTPSVDSRDAGAEVPTSASPPQGTSSRPSESNAPPASDSRPLRSSEAGPACRSSRGAHAHRPEGGSPAEKPSAERKRERRARQRVPRGAACEEADAPPESCIVQMQELNPRESHSREASAQKSQRSEGASSCSRLGERSAGRLADASGGDKDGPKDRRKDGLRQARALSADSTAVEDVRSREGPPASFLRGGEDKGADRGAEPERERKRRRLPSQTASSGSPPDAPESAGAEVASSWCDKWNKFYKRSFKEISHPFAERGSVNSMCGTMLVAFLTSGVLLFVFFQELVVNFTTFNGRCISPVLYPAYEAPLEERMPRIVSFGYGACEHNLGMSLYDRQGLQRQDAETENDSNEGGEWSPGPLQRRCASGTCAGDNGWPHHLVRRGNSQYFSAAFDSPNPRIFGAAGGLDTNKIRNYGEVFRVFWAMNLHGGRLHLANNIACQLHAFWILEPCWGFFRTLLLWLVGGVTGNLFSAVVDPCTVTIGSSGAFFGMLGALIPFSIEYWDHITSPAWFLFCVAILVTVAQLGSMIGLGGIDNNAHLGGLLGGLLFGLATIRSVHAFRWQGVTERMASSCLFGWMFPAEKRSILQEANRQRLLRDKRQRELGQTRFPKMTWKFRGHEGEWGVRLAATVGLVSLWVVLWLYLLVPAYYESLTTPPGNFSFSGYSGCHCCRVQPFPGDEQALPKYHTVRVNKGVFWCFSSAEAANVMCGRKSFLKPRESASPGGGSDANGGQLEIPELLPDQGRRRGDVEIAGEQDLTSRLDRLIRSVKNIYRRFSRKAPESASPPADSASPPADSASPPADSASPPADSASPGEKFGETPRLGDAAETRA